MRFEDWLPTVAPAQRRDPIWRRQDYSLAVYAADIAWPDCVALQENVLTASMADQLYRALSSIGANIAEGYSRGSGPDRVRFYEYALGSAREAREWYFKGRHVLPPHRVRDQTATLESIIRLLLTVIPIERQQRGRAPVRNESAGRAPEGARPARSDAQHAARTPRAARGAHRSAPHGTRPEVPGISPPPLPFPDG